MVGIPGSGKSTFASNIENGTVLSQDQFAGSRHLFMAKLTELIENKTNNIVIDRCNVTVKQRKPIMDFLSNNGYELTCILLADTPLDKCIERVKARKNHQTITESVSDERKEQIVRSFFNCLEMPKESEGFNNIQRIKFLDQEGSQA